MALDTMCLKEGVKRLGCVDGTSQAKAGEQDGWEAENESGHRR
jgi:hypothetical protein